MLLACAWDFFERDLEGWDDEAVYEASRTSRWIMDVVGFMLAAMFGECKEPVVLVELGDTARDPRVRLQLVRAQLQGCARCSEGV